MPKKMQSYRLDDRTIDRIKNYADHYGCSQAEVIESIFEIVADSGVIERLDGAARERFEERHGSTDCNLTPRMWELVRESYKMDFF